MPPDYSGTAMRGRTYVGKGSVSVPLRTVVPIKSGAMPPPEYRRPWELYPRIPKSQSDDREAENEGSPFGNDRFYTPDTPSPMHEHDEAAVTDDKSEEAFDGETESSIVGRNLREIRSDDVLLAALIVLMMGDVEGNREALLLLALIFLSAGIL